MAFVSARALDLRTAAPFGISRWTHSEFERFVVELRQGDVVGIGEGAPNARYGEDRRRDMDLLVDLAPEIADLEGPAAVETFCESGLSPEEVQAVLVASHGPFTWGRDAAAAVENATILEYIARMEIQIRAAAHEVKRPAQYLVDKHYLRKHGPHASYGQRKKRR